MEREGVLIVYVVTAMLIGFLYCKMVLIWHDVKQKEFEKMKRDIKAIKRQYDCLSGNYKSAFPTLREMANALKEKP